MLQIHLRGMYYAQVVCGHCKSGDTGYRTGKRSMVIGPFVFSASALIKAQGKIAHAYDLLRPA